MNPYSKYLIKSIHDYQVAAANPGFINALRKKSARLRHQFWSIITHSEIDPRAGIGEGLKLPHPVGVIIHSDAFIGRNCMIMQGVTIGMIEDGAVPTIEDNVYIGAGAKIIGKLTIGNGARIGANAVVIGDVPANATAIGVPARLVLRRIE